MTDYDVVPSKDKEKGKWAYRREGASKVSGFADTQKEAEKEAKKLSKNSGGGEVRIHDPKGKIRDSDTIAPAKDPFPPKDKKH